MPDGWFIFPGKYPVADDARAALAGADALVDFTTPSVSVALAALSAQAPHRSRDRTTGFSTAEKSGSGSRRASGSKSANMSLGVALLAALVRRAAKALPDFRCRDRRNASSDEGGCAVGYGAASGPCAAEGRCLILKRMSRPHARTHRCAQRRSIGFASLRGGTMAGEHKVDSRCPQELLFSNTSPRIANFRAGCALRQNGGQKPGLYTMADVVGLAE